MDNTPLPVVMTTVQQALDRDSGWVKYAKVALRSLSPQPARVDAATIAERNAFDSVLRGDTSGAVTRLAKAAEASADDRRAGQVLEQAASYADLTDPVKAQQLLAEAKSKNIYVLRSHAGITYNPLTVVRQEILAVRCCGAGDDSLLNPALQRCDRPIGHAHRGRTSDRRTGRLSPSIQRGACKFRVDGCVRRRLPPRRPRTSPSSTARSTEKPEGWDVLGPVLGAITR